MTHLRRFGWLLVLVVAVSLPALAADTLSIVIDDGAAYTTSRAVDIVLTYEGEEIPTQMRVFPDERGEWSEWTDYSTSLDWTLHGDEGPKTLTVETKYWAGLGWRIRSAEASIVYDATAPEIIAIVTPEANAAGWFNESVTVRFEATDGVSGVASVTDPTTLDVDGVAQSVAGLAADAAGNRATLVVRDINIDTVAPGIVAIVTPEANENGWYDEDVTVRFEATDDMSGVVSVTGPATFDSDGSGMSITGCACDAAGNTACVAVGDINVDKTAPELVAIVTPEPSKGGWYQEDVTVRFEATDSVSGVAYVSEPTAFAFDGANLAVTGYASDVAGNEATLSITGINVDTTAPTLSAIVNPGAAVSVWTPGPVTVSFDAADGLSGIGGATGTATLDDAGEGMSVTGCACDFAGLTTCVVVSNINIDIDLDTTTVALDVGATGAIDLGAKLEAFGTYDRDSIAIGAAFAGSDRSFTLTILAYDDATEKYSTVVAFMGCEYAATSGLYHGTLPMDRLVSGDTYEIWFEEIGGDEETVTLLVTVP